MSEKLNFRFQVIKAGKRTWIREYPLYDKHALCPTARYVGGISKYLCECQKPEECEGVIAVAIEYGGKDDN